MMIQSHSKSFSMLLVVSFFVLMIGGCWPENSIEWTADGKLGLVHVDDELWLIQEPNDVPKQLVADDVMPGPALSLDGQWIAYVEERDVNNLTEGLASVLSAQVGLLQQQSAEMRALILDSNQPSETAFPRLTEKGYEEGYRSWIVRHLCDNADAPLMEQLGDERLAKGKEDTELTVYDLYVLTGEKFTEKQKLYSSLCPIAFVQFSPDARALAYMLAPAQKDVYSYTLCISVLENQGESIRVAENVACICDWHPSGQRLAYLSTEKESDDDVWWGTLNEVKVRDDQGQLDSNAMKKNDAAWTSHVWDGTTEELAGVLFNPWTKVEYGLHDRLFFSSVSLSLPCSTKDEPQWSLFCYDPLTVSVTDLLPASLQQTLGEELRFFSLSPDKRNLLIGAQTVAIFSLDRQRDIVLVETELDDNDLIIPAWRGNDQVTCMLAEGSPLLKDGEYDGDQLVLLDVEGKLVDVFERD